MSNFVNIKKYNFKLQIDMVQAVRRSPPTTGVPSSRLGHSMWVSWWTKRDLGMFSSEFLSFSPTIPPFLHTYLIHFVSFHFISPCDCATRVVDRHPCYSLTFNIGASSHLVPRPGPVSGKSWRLWRWLLLLFNYIQNSNVYTSFCA